MLPQKHRKYFKYQKGRNRYACHCRKCQRTKAKNLEGMEVRPTTDKVKEAVFSSIQFDLPGVRSACISFPAAVQDGN